MTADSASVQTATLLLDRQKTFTDAEPRIREVERDT